MFNVKSSVPSSKLLEKLQELNDILDTERKSFEKVTQLERTVIEIRKEIDKEAPQVDRAAVDRKTNEQDDQRFMEFMMAEDITGKNVKSRVI